MIKAYAAWRAFQEWVLAPLAALLLIGSTLVALLEVFKRYIMGTSFEWQQDAVTYFILCGVFLYMSIAQRHGEHLTVTVVLEMLGSLGEKTRPVVETIKLVALALSLVFMVAVVWWGIPEVREAIHYETRTESLVFFMWPFLATLLVGFAFMAVTLIFQVWFQIQKMRGLEVPVEEHLVDQMPD